MSSALYETTVARSVDEVESLRPLWEGLQGENLPTDIDYFLTVSRYNPTVLRPHVVVVQPPEAEPSLLAGHLSRLRLNHGFGPRTPFRPSVRAISVYRGVVGRPTPEALSAALRSLAGELGPTADAILLHNLERGSPLFEASVHTFPARLRERWSPRKARWACEIGPTLEDTLRSRSSKTRENVRRIQRRIANDFGARAEVRILREPSEAETLFRDLDAVAVKTYQTRFSTVFSDDEFERRLVEVGMRKGWYRAYMLYVDERPIAFWTGYSYGGAFGWRGVTGYDPEYRSYSVGTYLLTHVLDDLSRDPGVRLFSLGPGDFPYKRFFGDRRWEEVDVRVFASTPRGIWVNAVGSGVQGLHATFAATRKIRRVDEWVDTHRERRRRKEQGLR